MMGQLDRDLLGMEIDSAINTANMLSRSREMSLVITKLEEAKLWLNSISSSEQASAPAKGGVADRQAEGHDAVGIGPAEAALLVDLEQAAEHAEKIGTFDEGKSV